MTSIEWTDETWNVSIGCSLVSAGCSNCYAMKFAHRELRPEHKGLTVLTKHHGPRWNGTVRFVESALARPLSWKKPRRIFVNSMSDLFHEELTNEQIAAVFGVMAACPQHTFQVLTKRPAIMRAWFAWIASVGARRAALEKGSVELADVRASTYWTCVQHAVAVAGAEDAGLVLRHQTVEGHASSWPLPNVWIGVSVEDQATADERIPLLLEAPAAKRFLSYEPALGPVDFGMSSATCDCCLRWPSRWVRLPHPVKADLPELDDTFCAVSQGLYRAESNRHGALSVRTRDDRALGIKPAEFAALPKLDWVICGGEAGPGSRPFDLAWARSTIEQCRVADVACFIKQLGAKPYEKQPAFGDDAKGFDPNDLLKTRPRPPQMDGWTRVSAAGETAYYRYPKFKHRKGADMNEWPTDLRVREFPT